MTFFEQSVLQELLKMQEKTERIGARMEILAMLPASSKKDRAFFILGDRLKQINERLNMIDRELDERSLDTVREGESHGRD
jgi:hypothetical protein